MFSTQSDNNYRITIFHVFDIISLFTVEMEEPKIGISGKGLTVFIWKKWAVNCKEHCLENWWKEWIQARCTGHCDITEIMLKLH